MNETDVRNILNRLVGSTLLLDQLNQLATLYQNGKIGVGGVVFTLNPNQKTTVKAAFKKLATKIEGRVKLLAPITGKTGEVDDKILSLIQEQPIKVFGYLNRYIEDTQTMLGLPERQAKAVEQADGYWAVPFADTEAQRLADRMATLAAGIKFLIDVQRLKVR